jgi:hypothetical protein
VADRAGDLDVPSQTEGSLSHGLQAEMSWKLRIRFEARAVVANLCDERFADQLEMKLDTARPCVLGRVVEGFLGNPEQGLLDRQGRLRLGANEIIDGDAVARP